MSLFMTIFDLIGNIFLYLMGCYMWYHIWNRICVFTRRCNEGMKLCRVTGLK
jgi:hypothetical protein